MSHNAIIQFPSEESRDRFLGWLSNSGEQDFFMSEGMVAEGKGKKPIRRFDYAQCFPAWGYDPKKHGPDKVVEAQFLEESDDIDDAQLR